MRTQLCHPSSGPGRQGTFPPTVVTPEVVGMSTVQSVPAAPGSGAALPSARPGSNVGAALAHAARLVPRALAVIDGATRFDHATLEDGVRRSRSTGIGGRVQGHE